MTRRALWRGIIRFGNVAVPVKLYSVIREQRPHFHLLHDQDQVRLVQQMVCPVEDKPVPREEIVRGLEVDEGRYVEVTERELAALELPPSRDIEVADYVPVEELDPRLFDRPYLLGPDEEEASFATLATALEKSGRAGICQWVMRKRPYLGALQVRSGAMELTTLHYSTEVVDTKALDLPHAKLNARERKTAQYLIQELTTSFNPGKFHNEFDEAVARLIEAKAHGRTIPARRAHPHKATDSSRLLEALEESVRRAHEDRHQGNGHSPERHMKHHANGRQERRRA